MFQNICIPRLLESVPPKLLLTRVYKVTGISESEVDQCIAPLYTPYRNPATTLLASPGEIEIHLRATGHDNEETENLLDELGTKIEAALGKSIFTDKGETLEEVIAALLTAQGKTIAVAEGCTGGKITERLTSPLGSSHFFRGSNVCYSNTSKMDLLNIPPALLEKHGAVSASVVGAMAQSMLYKTSASLSLATTGLCGPAGGTPDKPVGLIYIALANTQSIDIRDYRISGDRERIRHLASQTALERVRQWLLK